MRPLVIRLVHSGNICSSRKASSGVCRTIVQMLARAIEYFRTASGGAGADWVQCCRRVVKSSTGVIVLSSSLSAAAVSTEQATWWPSAR